MVGPPPWSIARKDPGLATARRHLPRQSRPRGRSRGERGPGTPRLPAAPLRLRGLPPPSCRSTLRLRWASAGNEDMLSVEGPGHAEVRLPFLLLRQRLGWGFALYVNHVELQGWVCLSGKCGENLLAVRAPGDVIDEMLHVPLSLGNQHAESLFLPLGVDDRHFGRFRRHPFEGDPAAVGRPGHAPVDLTIAHFEQIARGPLSQIADANVLAVGGVARVRDHIPFRTPLRALTLRVKQLAARPVRVHDPYAAGIITGEGDPLAVRGPTGHGSGSEILQSLAVGPAREHVRHRPAFPEDRATGIEGDFAPVKRPFGRPVLGVLRVSHKEPGIAAVGVQDVQHGPIAIRAVKQKVHVAVRAVAGSFFGRPLCRSFKQILSFSLVCS